MVVDQAKPINAKDVVEDPDLVYHLTSEYILLKDTSMMGTYLNMIQGINLCAERGWDTLSVAVDASNNMYALVRNMHYKHKNVVDEEPEG